MNCHVHLPTAFPKLLKTVASGSLEKVLRHLLACMHYCSGIIHPADKLHPYMLCYVHVCVWVCACVYFSCEESEESLWSKGSREGGGGGGEWVVGDSV